MTNTGTALSIKFEEKPWVMIHGSPCRKNKFLVMCGGPNTGRGLVTSDRDVKGGLFVSLIFLYKLILENTSLRPLSLVVLGGLGWELRVQSHII